MAKQPPKEQPATDEQPKTGRKKLFILVGVGLLALLLSAGVVGWLLLSGDDAEPSEPVAAAAPVRQAAIYQPLDPAFVVNYTHAGRQRFMQVSVVLMGRDPAGMAALTRHTPLIRNQLVMLFSSEDFEALYSPEGKEELRERATLTVQSLLEKEIGNPVVESVLFTNMVLQ
jgi:flagellar protein FliL